MRIEGLTDKILNNPDNKKLLNNFFGKFKDEINNNEFNKIYNSYELNILSLASFSGLITSVLYKAGIDPLLYMQEVPHSFLDHGYVAGIFKIPAGIHTIGMYAFDSCKITSLQIPTSVKSIDKGVVQFCKSLKYFEYAGTKQ